MKYPLWATLPDQWQLFGAALIEQWASGKWSPSEARFFELLGEAFFRELPVVRSAAYELPEPYRAEAVRLLDAARSHQ